MANALAMLLGKAVAEKIKRKGPPEDLVKAISDFRTATSDVDAADALLLAVKLAGESDDSDLADEAE